jgi:hypothetical protein
MFNYWLRIAVAWFLLYTANKLMKSSESLLRESMNADVTADVVDGELVTA